MARSFCLLILSFRLFLVRPTSRGKPPGRKSCSVPTLEIPKNLTIKGKKPHNNFTQKVLLILIISLIQDMHFPEMSFKNRPPVTACALQFRDALVTDGTSVWCIRQASSRSGAWKSGAYRRVRSRFQRPTGRISPAKLSDFVQGVPAPQVAKRSKFWQAVNLVKSFGSLADFCTLTDRVTERLN